MNIQMCNEKTELLMAELNKTNYPGYVMAVIHAGKIIYKTAQGLADVERNVPLTTQSVFDVASISKQFVATCIFVLESRKKLSLEDSIQQFIPEMPQKKEPQRLKHLIYHMSGVTDYLDLMEAAHMPEINRYTKTETIDDLFYGTRTSTKTELRVIALCSKSC